MAKTDLSLVIVSYNTNTITRDCLDSVNRSLRRSGIRYEIIVVDNDSKDGSKEMLAAYSKDGKNRTRYYQTGENLGFGRGNNFGVEKAKGEYLLLLNSDTIVLDNAIGRLYDFCQKNAGKVKFAGAKLLNRDLSPQSSACRFFTIPVVFASLLLKGDYYGLTRSSPTKTTKVDWVSGACIMTRRSLYRQLGGFDKNIFMYMEEVDLLYRAAKKGHETYFFPDAKIIHLGSASSGGKTFPILQVYPGFIFFYRKHYSALSLLLLHVILKTKAIIAVLIGKIKKDRYLTETYGQALKIT